MSAEKRRQEAERWLRQAEDGLDAGRALLAAGKFAQAAFLAQQAGEKAVRGLWLALGADPWGRSVARLIRDLPDEGARGKLQGLFEAALALDKLYIPTRYPDALAELTPSEAYTRSEPETALGHAASLLQAARTWLVERRP